MEETLRSFIAEKAADIDILPESLFVGDGTPLNWRRLLSFLHEHGVIAEPRFGTRSYRNDYPRLAQFFSLAPKLDNNADGQNVVYGGFGGSLNTEEAMSKSVGEVLERHFLSTFDRSTFHTASYADLSRSRNTLDIHSLGYFLDWQKKRFPEFDFDDHSLFRWVKGREFLSGASVYLPAQLVYWKYMYEPISTAREKVIFHQTTSGSGGHFTKEEALLSALLELIERDGFLIYWMNSLSPRVIDTGSIQNPVIMTLIETLRRFELEPVFLNTTSDLLVPSATCVIFDRANPEKPMLGIGSSAGFSLEDTLLACALESLVVLHSLTFLEPYVLPEKYEPFTSRRISRIERLCAWQSPAMAERFRFFVAGEKQSAQEFLGNAGASHTPQEQLASVANMLASRGNGYEIYTFEVKSAVLTQLGYHVVRAIVPALIPLHLIEHAAPLNTRRLRDVPEKIGYKAAEKLNPWPHPFP